MAAMLPTFAGSVATTAQSAELQNPLKFSAHHASVYVMDADKEQAFYEKALGFTTIGVRPDGDGETRQLAIPGFAIYLTKRSNLKPRPGEGSIQQGWRHIVLATPILDEVKKKLEAANASVTPYMVNGVLSRLRVLDPEGNAIEIVPLQ